MKPGARGALSALAGVVAGAVLAASAVFGSLASTDEPEPRSEPLALDRYCHHLHGGGATAYQPHNLEGWSCSVWTHGVWGLEPVDLNAACHWQRGENAHLGRLHVSERELPCTL